MQFVGSFLQKAGEPTKSESEAAATASEVPSEGAATADAPKSEKQGDDGPSPGAPAAGGGEAAESAAAASSFGSFSSLGASLYRSGESMLDVATQHTAVFSAFSKSGASNREAKPVAETSPSPAAEGAPEEKATEGLADVAPAAVSSGGGSGSEEAKAAGFSSLVGSAGGQLLAAVHRTSESIAPSATQAAEHMLTVAASTGEQLRTTAASTGGQWISSASATTQQFRSNAATTGGQLISSAATTGEQLRTTSASQWISSASATTQHLRSSAATTGEQLLSSAATTGGQLISSAATTREQLKSTAAATGEQLLASTGEHIKAASRLIGRSAPSASSPDASPSADAATGESPAVEGGASPGAPPLSLDFGGGPGAGARSEGGEAADAATSEPPAEEGGAFPAPDFAGAPGAGAHAGGQAEGSTSPATAEEELLQQPAPRELLAAAEMEAEVQAPGQPQSARCWRCGELVEAEIDALEAHSQTCLRVVPNAERVGPEAAEPGEAARDAASGAEAAESGGDDAGAGVSGSEVKTRCDNEPGHEVDGSPVPLGDAKVGTEGKQSSSSITSYVKDSAMLTSTFVGGTIVSVKTKAFSYFTWSSGGEPAQEGIVTLQGAQCGRYLTVLDGCPETKSHTSKAGVTEESQWFVNTAPTVGSVTIKNLLTGWFLRVVEDDGSDISARPAVVLAGGTRTERDEWRIIKGKPDSSARLQSVYNNSFLAVNADGQLGAVVASPVDGSVSEDALWRIAGFGAEPAASISARLGELTPDLDPVQLYSSLESTVERLTILMLDPVLNGVPKLGILPVRSQAQEYIKKHGTAKAALDALMVEAADDSSQAGYSRLVVQKVSELLLIRYLPFVGAGAYLSHTLFCRLRLAALAAELYGHDTQDAEVQGMLLFCALPNASGDGDQPDEPSTAKCGDETPAGAFSASNVRGPVLRAARSLSHVLARQVLQRATGFRTAADLYDLGAAILSERRGGGDTGVELESAEQATLRRAELLFRPSLARKLKPAEMALLAGGAALPTIASLLRKAASLAALAQRTVWVPEAATWLLLMALVVAAAVVASRHVPDIAAERPHLVSAAVLGGHAALPMLAAFDASGLVVGGFARTPMAAPLAAEDIGLAAVDADSGALRILVGVWAAARVVQRTWAPQGSAASRGEATPLQRTLLCVIVALGSLDVFGPDGLGLHPCPPFGALRSHHWLQAMLMALALECQLRLLILLKNGEVILRLLGATRAMGLAISLFLGGLTASVGFLVSRSEFTGFVDSLAPSPKASAAIIALRSDGSRNALAIGAMAGLLWELSPSPALAGAARLVGIAFGAAVVWAWLEAFEENREALLEPSGGRWLLVLPETSQKARLQALQVWTKLKVGTAGVAVEKGATYMGRMVVEQVLEYGASFWSKPLEKTAEVAAEAAIAAGGGGGVAAVADAVT